MQIGDDLIKARRFIDAAQAGLVRMNAGHETMPVLRAIRDDAQDMHARGIVRSAECTLAAITDAQTEEQIQRHIFSLAQLLGQYEAGLNEIAPVDTNVIDIDTRSERERTKDILAPLIRFAPAPEQRAALEFLVGFAPEPASINENLDGTHLETLMPSVTDQILSGARHAGKSVSVSYAVDDIVLPEKLGADIQAFLTELGERLVTDTLERPENRLAAGLPTNGLINITAKQEHGVLALHIECPGHSQAKTPVNLRTLPQLIGRGGIFSIEQIGDNTIARLVNIDTSAETQNGSVGPSALLQEAII